MRPGAIGQSERKGMGDMMHGTILRGLPIPTWNGSAPRRLYGHDPAFML